MARRRTDKTGPKSIWVPNPLTRCGRSTLTPAAAPALTGTCPGTPESARRAGRCGAKPLGRVKDHPRPIRQGSSEARHRGTGRGTGTTFNGRQRSTFNGVQLTLIVYSGVVPIIDPRRDPGADRFSARAGLIGRRVIKPPHDMTAIAPPRAMLTCIKRPPRAATSQGDAQHGAAACAGAAVGYVGRAVAQRETAWRVETG
jgi:hypothetical protein